MFVKSRGEGKTKKINSANVCESKGEGKTKKIKTLFEKEFQQNVLCQNSLTYKKLTHQCVTCCKENIKNTCIRAFRYLLKHGLS